MKIELHDVSKAFQENKVLDSVNLEFTNGKVYSFIGRNGSGKSVLFKIISGFYKPSSGRVLFDGLDINKDIKFPPSTRTMIESPNFIPTLSGYQNLELLADIQRKIGKDEIYDTLKKVNLFEDKDKLYHKYSLGMKQKLGLAQVLMENPEVMILDEPFNGIENESVQKLRNILLEEKNKGKIILIATHIREDIEILSDEIYQVDGGIVTRLV